MKDSINRLKTIAITKNEKILENSPEMYTAGIHPTVLHLLPILMFQDGKIQDSEIILQKRSLFRP